jgi:hypothetical protein
MKPSTIHLLLCFVLAPFAARAMVQHRDVLYQLQRHVIPMMAAVPVPIAALNEDSMLLTCNGAEREEHCIDSN